MKKDNKNNNKEFDENFIKQCGRVFANDLMRYSENGGDMENVTAEKVYKFLEELDKEKH